TNRAEYDDTAHAKAVNCHIWHGLRREFDGERGFHFLLVRQLPLLNIQDRVVVRPKKVDANGRHSNSDTEQQRAFDDGEVFPEFPPEAARLVIGYQPDPAFSKVIRVTLRRPKGLWVSQVNEPGTMPAWIDITPRELPFARGHRKRG